MVLKQLRISRHLSQEQLASMSGLSVRTIQRIENGSNPSVESLKCIAAMLEVDIETIKQEKLTMDKNSNNWQQLPLFLKIWFFFNFLNVKPIRKSSTNGERLCHISGFLFCFFGLISEPALLGGLVMLSIAYFYHFLTWQGDKYGIWYD